jgi:hypothetical protein
LFLTISLESSPSSAGSATLARAILSATARLFSGNSAKSTKLQGKKEITDRATTIVKRPPSTPPSIPDSCTDKEDDNIEEDTILSEGFLVPLISPFTSSTYPFCNWVSAINSVVATCDDASRDLEYRVVFSQVCPKGDGLLDEEWLIERLSALWYPMWCYIVYGDHLLKHVCEPSPSGTDLNLMDKFPESISSLTLSGALSKGYERVLVERKRKLEKCVSLYVKALDMLQCGFDLVSKFWDEQTLRIKSQSIDTNLHATANASKRLSNGI